MEENGYSDLNAHMQQVSLFIEKYRNEQKEKAAIKTINNSLQKEIDSLKKHNSKLIQDGDGNENTRQLATLYVDLKEKCQQLETINEKLINDKTSVEKKLQEIEQYYKGRIDDMQKSMGDLHLSQVASSLELDEIKIRYESRVNELNNKLKTETDTCNAYREEICSMTRQFSEEIGATNALNRELKSKLAFTENQLKVTQERLFEERQRKCLEDHSSFIMSKKSSVDKRTSHVINTSKYSPLQIVETKSTAIPIPPLKQITPAAPAKKDDRKKRKLYDPDSYDYLTDVD